MTTDKATSKIQNRMRRASLWNEEEWVSRMTDDFSTSPSPRDSRGFVEKINEEAN